MYKVETNPEFTELIHLCLIAFDSVSKLVQFLLFIGISILSELKDLLTPFFYAYLRCVSFTRTRFLKKSLSSLFWV